MTPVDLILGPQAPLGNSYFDQVQVSRGKQLGQSCPAVPPGDATALNGYILNLQYYDLPLTLYIAAKRTGDAAFTALARNVADSWWQHPQWIGGGSIRLWPDSATPPPRHAGIGGLILRAADGRPELWDWIVSYAQAHLNIWLKTRVNNAALYTGIREGAFALHYATWLAACLPDSYPLQAGGVATNGATTRAQLLADVENIVVNYHGRLQQPDGSWCWDDVDVRDADGGTLVGVMQPFQAGLLLCALADVHQLTTNVTVRVSVQNQILKGCRHLYADGPYRKDEPIPYDPAKRRRDFWYLYHGGTTVNPTKFEQGGWSYPGTSITEIQDGRQAIGPIVAAYGYAYKLSGDTFFRDAGDELWDSAYGSTDGIHNFFDTDGKGYNQNARRAGSYLAWRGGTVATPAPTPAPLPAPAPVTAIPIITSPLPDATLAGIVNVIAALDPSVLLSAAYLIVDGLVVATGTPLTFKLDTTKLTDGGHSLFVRAWDTGGTAHDSAVMTVTVANAIPATTPAPAPCSMTLQAAVIPQWGSGKLVVSLSGLANEGHTVTAFADSGQVTVSPSSQTFTGTAAVLEFKLQAKKKSATVTVNGPCGTKSVQVVVK